VAVGGAGLWIGAVAPAAQIDVGTGTGCEAATLQDALGVAAFNGVGTADEIRLTRTVTYTDIAVEISDWDPANEGALVLSGGWDSCTDATASGQTVLSGDPAAVATIQVRGPNQSSYVTLRRLELEGGSRGLRAEGAASVIVQATSIRLNQGGIAVLDGADVEIDWDAQVVENAGANLGGGVFCTGAGSRVTIFGHVADNTATSAGGGIYANSGCLVRLRSNVWIERNQANLGGGLFLSGSARAENLGTGTAYLNIYENIATAEGGGIYMAGTGPQTLLGNVRIVSNHAGERGGGVALVGGARLQVERFNFEQCVTAPRCVKINENSVGEGGIGSAVYADGGSEFRMAQGYVEANTDPVFAAVALFFATGGTTSMLLEGVQVAHNSAQSIFVAEDGAEIVAAFVSAARNFYEFLGAPVSTRIGDATGGARIDLFTSILADHHSFYSAGGEIHADCVLLETTEGLTGHAVSIVGLDPLFVDADAGDLHLRPGSPAIDSCDAAVYSPLDSDFDLDARGYDFDSRPNLLGPFDRGADELRPIFANGFESGTTGGWSATVG